MATRCYCGRQLFCFVLFVLLAGVALAFDHQLEREAAVVGVGPDAPLQTTSRTELMEFDTSLPSSFSSPGSTHELRYLRGNTVTVPESVSTELGDRYESFEEFERRELVDSGYPSDPADPNCDNDPTLCAP